MREIAGESVLVSVGNGVADFCGIVKLNDSAKVIWSALQNGTTQEELIQALVNTFHITENQAKMDVVQSLELLLNKRMITCE
ncbi:PqqD family protein [Sharpea azabuensis]|uniref:PqqD family protein n=1 Tax=Sharpea azabuensis TaxID=322505 RepID=UPI00156C4047|nr:PqqD family protein [Sharpea azabuensis]